MLWGGALGKGKTDVVMASKENHRKWSTVCFQRETASMGIIYVPITEISLLIFPKFLARGTNTTRFQWKEERTENMKLNCKAVRLNL